MKIMHGPIGDTYAWLVIKEGHIVDQGYDEDPETAQQQMKAAAAFWETHTYEIEE
ncbi:hypothetical protein [Nocardioides abyssi]|uniref:Phage protein n=1 Tax=Nocardioides abyssi TaxID=3058370 RepID=A0ABT8EYC4_9ACTN|nr:hypothetical protein [Nocardioides abyssi]MDN4162956.1 hypothetical protein [Nocardioides abyssi]